MTWPADIGDLVVDAMPESGKRLMDLRNRGVHVIDK